MLCRVFCFFEKQFRTAIFLHKSYCSFPLDSKLLLFLYNWIAHLHDRTHVWFFLLPHLGREKVLEDDELENKDLDIKSEEIEEGAFENNNLLAEILKQSLQRLGKGLVNGEYFVNASVEMLVPLYNLNQNNAWTISSKT